MCVACCRWRPCWNWCSRAVKALLRLQLCTMMNLPTWYWALPWSHRCRCVSHKHLWYFLSEQLFLISWFITLCVLTLLTEYRYHYWYTVSFTICNHCMIKHFGPVIFLMPTGNDRKECLGWLPRWLCGGSTTRHNGVSDGQPAVLEVTRFSMLGY